MSFVSSTANGRAGSLKLEQFQLWRSHEFNLELGYMDYSHIMLNWTLLM